MYILKIKKGTMRMTHFKKQKILFSKYNDLSKIYDLKSNKWMKTIPSPSYYYDSKRKVFEEIININDTGPILIKKYSVLGFNDKDNNNEKAALVKFQSGFIALKIPYLKLFKLYKDDS